GRAVDRHLLHADDRGPRLEPAVGDARRPRPARRLSGRRDARVATAAGHDPVRGVPRLQPDADAARAAVARRAAARPGRGADRPLVLPRPDRELVPHRTRVRVRLRDRRVPDRGVRVTDARRQVPPRRDAARGRRGGTVGMTERTFRIGEVAERLGVTPRTIRYYQELGLLHAGSERAKGAHRLFTEADVARLADLIGLRDLLGLSLEELTALAEAEEARAELRGQWAESRDDAARAAILEQAIPHVRRQLELVEGRQQTLAGVR